MIGYFPTPLPDEIFYSVCARFQDRMQYPSVQTINLELFGTRQTSPSVDLPSHLGHFSIKLDSPPLSSVDNLIYRNTLFPFYSPFLTPERVERIWRDMEGQNGSTIHKCASIAKGSVRPPDWLRFCSLCVQRDREEFKECYWHRVHQVPGVEVCSVHTVFLEDSAARARYQPYSESYVTAEQAVTLTTPRQLDLTDPCHRRLLNIANDVSWLLNQRDLSSKYKSLRDGYVGLLEEMGLATPSGTVRFKKFLELIREYYPLPLLKTVQSNFREHNTGWPFCIVRKAKWEKADHPIRHLLIIGLLRHSAQSFFETVLEEIQVKAPKPSKPYGIGPWPCLNSVCPKFRKLKIRNCDISKSWRVDGTLIGTFTCVCGFTYARRGHDKSSDDRFQYDWVETYGNVWEEALKKLWKDASISLRKMRLRLNAHGDTIKRQAVRLDLPFPRNSPGPGSDTITIRPEIQNRSRRGYFKKSSTAREKLHQFYRSEWRSAIKGNPRMSRTRLRWEIAPRAYNWLRRHDSAWLKAHMPVPLKAPNNFLKVDWEKRDIQLAEEVRRSAKRVRSFKNKFGRPIQITKQSIAKDIDKRTFLCRKYLTKLPMTVKALDDVVETTTEFAIRRLQWATDCFRRQGISLSRRELAQRASISWKSIQIQEVEAALNASWESLQDLDINVDANAA
jgi:hypothetical protein